MSAAETPTKRARNAVVRWTAAAVATAILTTSGSALAYRPFDGTDADTAHPGEFELEMGPAYQARAGRSASLALPALVLNQGLLPGWELVVDARNVVGADPNASAPPPRVDDVDVQLKWVLRRGSLQGASGLSIATEFGPLLPSLGGETGFGADANLIVSQRWADFTVHLNGGVARTRDASTMGVASLILEGPAVAGVRPVAEPLVSHDVAGPTVYSLLAGAIWQASDDLALDVATRGGLEDGAGVVEVRVGLTWSLPVWVVGPAAAPPFAASR
jgi:hypothetical protein